MKSWPTLVPLRHARFYAPKEEVFVTCCQLACKGGVFAARTIIPFSGLIVSQHLRRWNWQRFGASPKIISRERSTPVCCPNYKTNSKGAFFWENPKNGFVISDHTESSPPKKWKIRERIIYHDNGMSSYSSWKKNNNNKLILTAKTRRKSNISYKWIYEMDIFWFETQTFLE